MKIGIDIGGMSAKIGLCDGGNLVKTSRIRTGGAIGFAELTAQLGAELCAYRADEYDFIGISSCGLIDSVQGCIVYSNNIAWENKPLVQILHDMTGKPVRIANDAKCAALGEAVYGAGRGFERVCMLTLGTGVGGGFVVQGKLQGGSPYADAEGIFGHILAEKNGRQCTCGRRGCLEAYASATAVMKAHAFRTGNNLTAKEIFDGARAGGREERFTVEEFTDYLGEGITDLVNVLRPQIVVIGGGLSGGADLFLDELREKVNQKIYGGKFLPVKIEAALLGNDAGMIGATLL